MSHAPWAPLLELRRDGLPEVTVYGSIAWASPSAVLAHVAGARPIYLRSLAKPVLAKALAGDIPDTLGTRQRALGCGSHDGTAEHVAVAQSMVPPALHPRLRTPVSMPLGARVERPPAPTGWHHPCSGEHAMLLAVAAHRSWDLHEYLSPTHPSFRALLEHIEGVLGPQWAPHAVATDGCGLPTPALEVGHVARLFASLVVGRDEDSVWPGMCEHPALVGGEDRLDTLLLRTGRGRLLAKEGADGLLAISIVHPDHPEGLGLLIKTAHGWQPTWLHLLARELLAPLGFVIPGPDLPVGQTLHLDPDAHLPR